MLPQGFPAGRCGRGLTSPGLTSTPADAGLKWCDSHQKTMSTFPKTPKLTRARHRADVPGRRRAARDPLQYNPEKLTRTLQAQFVEPEGQNRSDPARLTGPPIETIKLEAIVDAADDLEHPEAHRDALHHGVQPLLAALELTIYPHSTQLEKSKSTTNSSAIEVSVTESPLTVFVWGRSRIVPVRITNFSVTEEFFDPALHPIRAQVSIDMRVLSVTDFSSNHVGSNLTWSITSRRSRSLPRSAASAASWA